MANNGFKSSKPFNTAKEKTSQKPQQIPCVLSTDDSSGKWSKVDAIKQLTNSQSVFASQPPKRSTLRQLAEDVMVVATNGIVSTPPAAFKSSRIVTSLSPSDSPHIERSGLKISPKGSPGVTARGSPSLNSLRLRSQSPRNSPRLLKASFHKSHTERSASDEAERSLHILVKLASNWECVTTMLDSLLPYMRNLLPLIEQVEAPAVEKYINELFNQLLQTCYSQLTQANTHDVKHSIFLELSKLLNVSLELIRGKQSLHFTALSTINRIMDICIVHKNYEFGSPSSKQDGEDPHIPATTLEFGGGKGAGGHHRSSVKETNSASEGHPVRFQSHAHPHTGLSSRLSSSDESSTAAGFLTTSSRGLTASHTPLSSPSPTSPSCIIPGSAVPTGSTTSAGSTSISYSATLNRISSLHKRRASQAQHDHQQQPPCGSDEDDPSKQGSAIIPTPLEILLSLDPSQIVSCLHNNITMHKRIIGTRQKCTPSVRQRHCTHHCLQILSARVLTLMCHSANVQHKLVTRGHLKMLVEALDPNHDPRSSWTFRSVVNHMSEEQTNI